MLMSITGLLVRFLLLYPPLLLVAGLAASYFEFKPSGLNIAILLPSVMIVCQWFAKKNGRYFTNGEQRIAVLGMWVIDLIVQLLGTAAASAQALTGDVLMLSMALVGVLHLIAIFMFVRLTKSQAKKQGWVG
jgi:hypothetical protein